eukprot:gene9567-1719_t
MDPRLGSAVSRSPWAPSNPFTCLATGCSSVPPDHSPADPGRGTQDQLQFGVHSTLAGINESSFCFVEMSDHGQSVGRLPLFACSPYPVYTSQKDFEAESLRACLEQSETAWQACQQRICSLHQIITSKDEHIGVQYVACTCTFLHDLCTEILPISHDIHCPAFVLVKCLAVCSAHCTASKHECADAIRHDGHTATGHPTDELDLQLEIACERICHGSPDSSDANVPGLMEDHQALQVFDACQAKLEDQVTQLTSQLHASTQVLDTVQRELAATRGGTAHVALPLEKLTDHQSESEQLLSKQGPIQRLGDVHLELQVQLAGGHPQTNSPQGLAITTLPHGKQVPVATSGSQGSFGQGLQGTGPTLAKRVSIATSGSSGSSACVPGTAFLCTDSLAMIESALVRGHQPGDSNMECPPVKDPHGTCSTTTCTTGKTISVAGPEDPIPETLVSSVCCAGLAGGAGSSVSSDSSGNFGSANADGNAIPSMSTAAMADQVSYYAEYHCPSFYAEELERSEQAIIVLLRQKKEAAQEAQANMVAANMDHERSLIAAEAVHSEQIKSLTTQLCAAHAELECHAQGKLVPENSSLLNKPGADIVTTNSSDIPASGPHVSELIANVNEPSGENDAGSPEELERCEQGILALVAQKKTAVDELSSVKMRLESADQTIDNQASELANLGTRCETEISARSAAEKLYHETLSQLQDVQQNISNSNMILEHRSVSQHGTDLGSDISANSGSGMLRHIEEHGMLQAIQGALEGCDEDGDEDNQLQSQTFDLDECDLDKMIPRAQGAPIDSPLPFPDMDDVVGKPSSFLRDHSYTAMPNKLDTAGYCGNVPMLVEQNAYLSEELVRSEKGLVLLLSKYKEACRVLQTQDQAATDASHRNDSCTSQTTHDDVMEELGRTNSSILAISSHMEQLSDGRQDAEERCQQALEQLQETRAEVDKLSHLPASQGPGQGSASRPSSHAAVGHAASSAAHLVAPLSPGAGATEEAIHSAEDDLDISRAESSQLVEQLQSERHERESAARLALTIGRQLEKEVAVRQDAEE